MRKGGGGRYLPAILLQPPRGAGLHLTLGRADEGAAVRTAGGGRPRAVRASGPTASPRVPGRVAEGGKEEGAGGRRKAGGGVWAGHAAPASARRSRARSQGWLRLSAHRSDSRLEPPGPLCPGPALPAGGEASDRQSTTWPAHLASPLPAPRRHLGLGLLLPPAEGRGGQRG